MEIKFPVLLEFLPRLLDGSGTLNINIQEEVWNADEPPRTFSQNSIFISVNNFIFQKGV